MTADPALLRTVADDSGSAVTVTGPLRHRCPHVEEVDAGTVTCRWRGDGVTVELHSLAAYLRSWEGQRISHEAITAQVAADLAALEGIEVLTVSSSWRTAGLDVEVTAGR